MDKIDKIPLNEAVSSNKEESTVTLYVANLIRTTTADEIIDIIGGLKVSLPNIRHGKAERERANSYNITLHSAIAKINSYIDQHQPPSDKAELDPDISELLRLVEGDRFGRLDYYPRDWAILDKLPPKPSVKYSTEGDNSKSFPLQLSRFRFGPEVNE